MQRRTPRRRAPDGGRPGLAQRWSCHASRPVRRCLSGRKMTVVDQQRRVALTPAQHAEAIGDMLHDPREDRAVPHRAASRRCRPALLQWLVEDWAKCPTEVALIFDIDNTLGHEQYRQSHRTDPRISRHPRAPSGPSHDSRAGLIGGVLALVAAVEGAVFRPLGSDPGLVERPGRLVHHDRNLAARDPRGGPRRPRW